MYCWRYRRMLHLNREGELSSEESRALALHLSGCRACRARLATIVEADKIIQRARLVEPQLSVSRDLAARVFSQRWDRSDHFARGFDSTVRSHPLDILLSPAVCHASAAAALLMWMVFFLQGFSLLERVSDLERMMSTRPVATAGPQVAYPVTTATLRMIPESGRIAKFLETLPRYAGGMLIPRSVIERYAVFVPGFSVEAALALGIDAKQLVSFSGLIESHPVIMFHFADKAH